MFQDAPAEFVSGLLDLMVDLVCMPPALACSL